MVILSTVRAAAMLTAGGMVLALAACSGPKPVPDAGLDAAVDTDAGTDAGVQPVCLGDAPDGSVDGGALDGGRDAGNDFSCLGRPTPPGGQATLVVAGTVTTAGFTRRPRADIPVALCAKDGTVLATGTSDDAGAFTLSTAAGCEPLDGYVRTVNGPDAGLFDAYYVPSQPWRYDREGVELVLFDSVTRNLVGQIAGVTIQNGTGVVALTIADCADEPVGGAVLSIDGGVVRYVAASGLPSATLTATDTTGEALVFNLAPGTATLTAVSGATSIGPRTLPVFADGVTATTLMPR